MSGGKYNYAYLQVDNLAEDITTDSPDATANVLRERLKTHLALVAKALHDIEWVDSGDKVPGEEINAILDVFLHAEKYT